MTDGKLWSTKIVVHYQPGTRVPKFQSKFLLKFQLKLKWNLAKVSLKFHVKFHSKFDILKFQSAVSWNFNETLFKFRMKFQLKQYWNFSNIATNFLFRWGILWILNRKFMGDSKEKFTTGMDSQVIVSWKYPFVTT